MLTHAAVMVTKSGIQKNTHPHQTISSSRHFSTSPQSAHLATSVTRSGTAVSLAQHSVANVLRSSQFNDHLPTRESRGSTHFFENSAADQADGPSEDPSSSSSEDDQSSVDSVSEGNQAFRDEELRREEEDATIPVAESEMEDNTRGTETVSGSSENVDIPIPHVLEIQNRLLNDADGGPSDSESSSSSSSSSSTSTIEDRTPIRSPSSNYRSPAAEDDDESESSSSDEDDELPHIPRDASIEDVENQRMANPDDVQENVDGDIGFREEDAGSNLAPDEDDEQELSDEDEIEIIEEIQQAIEEEMQRDDDAVQRHPSFYRNKKKRPSNKEISTLALNDITARYVTPLNRNERRMQEIYMRLTN